MLTKGTYYVGDLCYVFSNDEWDEVIATTFGSDGTMLEGEFKLKDGRTFAMYRTAYGDGTYDGCSVDSGTIGCILYDDIVLTDNCTPAMMQNLGRIEVFTNNFNTYNAGGIMSFGNVTIDTIQADADACW
tara:strand:+ start:11228 stop:11617 length:390 start_codon:yes stop_codon:yes gene_type:complete